MSYPDKDLAAGGTIVGSYAPLDLFAGDADVITEEETVVAGQGVLAKHTVVGKITASGKLAVLTPGAVDGSQIAYGILTQAVTATADVGVAVYTGGFFNEAALVWPGAIATLAQRKLAFAGTSIHIGKVRL